MKFTLLLDNKTEDVRCRAEWGLSVLIETRGRRILLDSGPSGLFAENAARLGIDLAEVDAAVISHGHYDHTEGIPAFVACNEKAPIYLHRQALGTFFGETHGLVDAEACGVRWTEAQREKILPRVVWTDHRTDIFPGVTLLADIPPAADAGVTERFWRLTVDPDPSSAGTPSGATPLANAASASAGAVAAGPEPGHARAAIDAMADAATDADVSRILAATDAPRTTAETAPPETPHLTRPLPAGMRLVRDDMAHEQALVVEENGKLYVFSGCSHGGVLHILQHVQETFPDVPVAGLVAGMHLIAATEATRQAVADALAGMDLDFVFPVHCTGMAGILALKNRLGARCVIASAGDSYVY